MLHASLARCSPPPSALCRSMASQPSSVPSHTTKSHIKAAPRLKLLPLHQHPTQSEIKFNSLPILNGTNSSPTHYTPQNRASGMVVSLPLPLLFCTLRPIWCSRFRVPRIGKHDDDSCWQPADPPLLLLFRTLSNLTLLILCTTAHVTVMVLAEIGLSIPL